MPEYFIRCKVCQKFYTREETDKMKAGEECTCGNVLLPVPWNPQIKHTAVLVKKVTGIKYTIESIQSEVVALSHLVISINERLLIIEKLLKEGRCDKNVKRFFEG